MNVINAKGAFDIRPMTTGDLPYVIPSWMRTFKNSPEFRFPGLLSADYFRHQHLIIDDLIPRAHKRKAAYVCHHRGAPSLIRGYLVAEPYKHVKFVHWCMVKKTDWGKGVASALMERFIKDHGILPDDNILYTHGSNALLPVKPTNPRHGFVKHIQEKYNLVYYPWFRYTSLEPGWETGGTPT